MLFLYIVVHLNNYQITMAKSLGCEYTPVKETGKQLLDGLQAVAYCRIRYTTGNDFSRTERQREVIEAIAAKAFEADIQTLIDIANETSETGMVYTSLDIKEILELLASIKDYRIVDQTGFPAEKYRNTAVLGSEGDCVIPMDLELSVKELHRFLFGDENYQVSDTVASYSQDIRDKVAIYKPDFIYPQE